MKPILVLGLGNLLQADDGVGCRVAQALEQCRLPDAVEVMDGGTPGIGLLDLLQGRQCVIIVDAAELHAQPGEFKQFHPQDVLLTGSAERFSLHQSGVANALVLALELEFELPELIVFGVQPERVGWGDRLSPRVQAAVPQVAQAVLRVASSRLLDRQADQRRRERASSRSRPWPMRKS